MNLTGQAPSQNVTTPNWLQRRAPNEVEWVGNQAQPTDPGNLRDFLHFMIYGQMAPHEVMNGLPKLGWQLGQPQGSVAGMSGYAPHPALPFDPQAVSARLGRLPFNGMGFTGDAALEAARTLDENAGDFSANGMGRDRTRPWAENASQGTDFLNRAGKTVIPAANRSATNPDFWRQSVLVPEFKPEWIQPAKKSSTFGEMFRSLFGG